jgi:lipopolysaccharide assembly outer membrane protein LptD (OstA)
MKVKIILQFFLLLIILIFLYIFFNFFFVKKNKDESSIDIIENIDTNELESSNIIYNLKYKSEDLNGNKYLIRSAEGKLNKDQPENISLYEVYAEIIMLNSPRIYIKANEAIYNNLTFNTRFFGDVDVNYKDNKIYSDNLDIDFEKNLASIYNNVIYKNLKSKLDADKVEIDLISKTTNIFRYSKKDKINITSSK